MSDLLDTLVVLAYGLLPFVGYRSVQARPGHSDVQLIVGAATGGLGASLVVALLIVMRGGMPSDVLPYMIGGVLSGTTFGVVGVAALRFGRWWRRRS